ncbi:MAG: hypothetical protein AB2A00_15260 [Myxococcota bacterium]
MLGRVWRFLAGFFVALVPAVAVSLAVWSPLLRKNPHLPAPRPGDYASAVAVTLAALWVGYIGFNLAVRALHGVPDAPPRRGQP